MRAWRVVGDVEQGAGDERAVVLAYGVAGLDWAGWMSATLLEFPDKDIRDIPRGLRDLADLIEAADYGPAHHLIWVVDRGDARIDVGLLGATAEPGAVGYHLLGIGMRKLECP